MATTTVNIYLNFDGNCGEAFNFYKSIFGGEFQYIGRYKDMPTQEGLKKMDPKEAEKIMHVSLPISSESILMGCDMAGEWASGFNKGNNFSVSINTDSKAEADSLFSGLSSGGQVKMPMNKTFWGAYFRVFTDKFGISWTVSFDEQPQK